jgi:putative membrane protein
VTTPPPGTRTGLAWQRTGLGLIAVAALIGARGLNSGEDSLWLIASAAVLPGAGILGVLAPVRYRQVQRRQAACEEVAAPGAVIMVTVAFVLVALAAVAAVLVTLRSPS